MKELRLRDLKKHLEIEQDIDSIKIEIKIAIPVLGFDNLLLPLRMQHYVQKDIYQKNKFKTIHNLIYELSKEVVRHIIFYQPFIRKDGESFHIEKGTGNRWEDYEMDRNILIKLCKKYLPNSI